MAEDRSDDPGAPPPGEGERVRTGFRRRLGRLLNQRELAEDTREVFSGVLEMSDRAKTEAVRLVAREARNYLDELKIKEDLLDLITSHSLEVQLSVHLKPLADAVRDEPAVPRRPERRGDREPEPARARTLKPRARARPVDPQPIPDDDEDEDDAPTVVKGAGSPVDVDDEQQATPEYADQEHESEVP